MKIFFTVNNVSVEFGEVAFVFLESKHSYKGWYDKKSPANQLNKIVYLDLYQDWLI